MKVRIQRRELKESDIKSTEAVCYLHIKKNHVEKSSLSINTLGNEFYNLGIAVISRNAEDGFSHKYFILLLKKYAHRENSEANVGSVTIC